MTPEELSAWTPIALAVGTPEPAIDWCDLRGLSFGEPFFAQTVARWTTGTAARPVIRTGLSALQAADGYGTCLEPSGFIFQMSRCGSTLVSRLLGRMPGTVVVSEADAINALLAVTPQQVPRPAQVQNLRLLIRALGRRRLGDERHYVIKFSSWAINHLALLGEAFPGVPWIWVYREPAAVLASVLADAPGWMRLRFRPRLAQHLLGITSPLSLATPEAFAAEALANFAAAALAGDDGRAPFIDYRDLPQAIWRTVAPAFGMAPDARDIAAMTAEARWSAHQASPTPFAPRTPSGAQPPAVPARLAGLHRAMAERAARTAGEIGHSDFGQGECP